MKCHDTYACASSKSSEKKSIQLHVLSPRNIVVALEEVRSVCSDGKLFSFETAIKRCFSLAKSVW